MAVKMIKQTKHTGMGAIVYEGGVAFRVWAPHAESLAVTGDFNLWNEGAHPLEHEGNGYWYIDIPGAKAGQEYKFLIYYQGERLYRVDPYARQVTNSVGNSVIYDPNSFDWHNDQHQLPPHNELVIYEMHIGSFTDGEGNKPGNFYDAIQKFDHLKQLGINAIQVMPIAEFPGDYSWGYNPANIFAVETIYGGPDGYKQFVREAHKAGFSVIQDVVYNHFGPSDLDLWRFDGWHEGDYGGIYFFNDDRAVTPWGATRPDYGRTEVRQFIRDNALMWLEEYHADGLRLDSTLFVRTKDGEESNPIEDGSSLMADINAEIRARHSHVILIAEDLRNNELVTRDSDNGGMGFHAQWDANFVHPIRAMVEAISDEGRSMQLLKDLIDFTYDNDAFKRIIYSESHDEVANGKARVPQEVDPANPTSWFAQKRSTLAAGLVFTAPGIPMIFQGQEFLQGDWFQDNVPLDWDFNEDFHGITRLYRDLIRRRRNWNDQTRGLRGQFLNVFHLNQEDKMLAFQRWDQHGKGDDVIIVLNCANELKENYQIGFPAEGLWKLRFNSDASIYSDAFTNTNSADVEAHVGEKDGLYYNGNINIGPYSVLIYSQDR
ncbi:MAG: alpha-amylase family glycosyl hydrolase [Anaerolineaceae bacterium]|jgi:1,4-alpha-glucan branching enzyme